MRLPFDLSEKLEENARVKFLYTSPELHQTIEISLDGHETSVEALVDAFERFLGALGISIPPNVSLGFIEEDEDEEDDDDDNDKNDDPPSKNGKKKS
jgi:hypothetical protein